MACLCVGRFLGPSPAHLAIIFVPSQRVAPPPAGSIKKSPRRRRNPKYRCPPIPPGGRLFAPLRCCGPRAPSGSPAPSTASSTSGLDSRLVLASSVPRKKKQPSFNYKRLATRDHTGVDRWLARPPCHPCSYHRGPEGSFTYINIYIFRRINLFVYFIYRWPKCLVYLFSLARRWRDDVKLFFSGFRTLVPCEARAVQRKKHLVDDNIRGKPFRSAGVNWRRRRGQECRLLVRIIVSELNDFSIGLSGCSSGGGGGPVRYF